MNVKDNLNYIIPFYFCFVDDNKVLTNGDLVKLCANGLYSLALVLSTSLYISNGLNSQSKVNDLERKLQNKTKVESVIKK